MEGLEKAIENINAKAEEINANGLEVKSLKEKNVELEGQVKSTKDELVKMSADLVKLKEVPTQKKQKSVLDVITEKKEGLESISKKNRDASIDFSVKATSTYGDIDAGLDFAPMRPGITDLVKKQTRFIDLFKKTPFNGEFYKYAEQETVVRNAQNVAVCSPVTSNTKETIITKNIITKKIKDVLKFCSDYANDYGFVEGRLRTLINDSVLFKADTDVLLGDGTGDNMSGIDSYASEFDADNTDAPIGATINNANYIDLILAMQAQIYTLGQENGYAPDTVILNYLDWFSLVLSSKDADANYLDYRNVNMGTAQINGMTVITSPDVPANTCYVLDKTKGEMIINQNYEVSMAYENATDWESDLVAMKGSIRANLLVETPNVNAFMKCSDVAAGITSINKVTGI
jgi:hypothetical protein